MTATRIRRLAVWLCIIGTGVVFLVPFYFALVSSVKSAEELLRMPPTLIPESLTLNWYAAVLDAGALQWALNTLIYAGASTLAVCLGSALFGFILVRERSRLGSLVFAIVLASMMIPTITYVLGLFDAFLDYERATGLPLIGTWWGLLAPASVSAFGVFLMRQAMLSFPPDLVEAARVDGASTSRTFFSVVLPLLRPQLTALALIHFLAMYADVLWPLIMAADPGQYTLSVGLASLAADYLSQWGLVTAGAVIAAIPAIVIFALFGRNLVSGLHFQTYGR